jgi:hypothetical protein
MHDKQTHTVKINAVNNKYVHDFTWCIESYSMGLPFWIQLESALWKADNLSFCMDQILLHINWPPNSKELQTWMFKIHNFIFFCKKKSNLLKYAYFWHKKCVVITLRRLDLCLRAVDAFLSSEPAPQARSCYLTTRLLMRRCRNVAKYYWSILLLSRCHLTYSHFFFRHENKK